MVPPEMTGSVAEKTDTSRRRLVTWLLGTTVGALLVSIFYPIARYLSPPEIPESTANQVDAGPANAPEFRSPGYKIVRFGNEPVLVFRLGPDDFRALSATCTHLDCIVEYQRDKGRIWCNCHNGMYDLAGRVVSGPPPRPLQAFRVDLVSRAPGQVRAVVVSKA